LAQLPTPITANFFIIGHCLLDLIKVLKKGLMETSLIIVRGVYAKFFLKFVLKSKI
jgi:hypothetical protein